MDVSRSSENLGLKSFHGFRRARRAQSRIVKLCARKSYLAEEMQVGRHDYTGAKMDGRREGYFAGEVVGHEPNRQLTLAMRLLVDRGRDRPLFKVRRHLRKEIRRDQLNFSREAACSESAAHRKTVHGIYVESSQGWNTAQKIKRLLETLVFVLVSFNYRGNRTARAVPWEGFREAIGFFAMILSRQHTRNHGHFGALRHKLAH